MTTFFSRAFGMGNTRDLPPVPGAPPSREEAAAAAAQQMDEERRRRIAGGRASTILTGEEGVPGFKTKLGAA